MTAVDRTCPQCKKDRGILRYVWFYDFDALKGNTDRKYPRGNCGLLNSRLICGDEPCFKAAMAERKKELEHVAH